MKFWDIALALNIFSVVLNAPDFFHVVLGTGGNVIFATFFVVNSFCVGVLLYQGRNNGS